MTSWTVPCRGRRTSPYGPRLAPVKGATTWHRGVDIAPPVRGQREPVDVHCVGAGRVRAVGRDTERGVWVVVTHDDGSATTYQHLAARVVAAGMRVAAGSTLGVMGATGTDAGVHLHLEAFPDADAWVQRGTSWRSAAAIDPELYLAARGVHLLEAIAVSDPIITIPDAPAAPAPGQLPAPLTTSQEDDMLATIKALYADALGRTGTIEEWSTWLTPTRTEQGLVAAFLAVDAEACTVVKAFHDFMPGGRDPDPAGLEYWLGRRLSIKALRDAIRLEVSRGAK